MSLIDSTLHPHSPGTAPISLDELARRAAELWSIEPQVHIARRTELLSELRELECDLDALVLKAVAGIDVHPAHVRRCAQHYLWLRQEWGDLGIAA